VTDASLPVTRVDVSPFSTRVHISIYFSTRKNRHTIVSFAFDVWIVQVLVSRGEVEKQPAFMTVPSRHYRRFWPQATTFLAKVPTRSRNRVVVLGRISRHLNEDTISCVSSLLRESRRQRGNASGMRNDPAKTSLQRNSFPRLSSFSKVSFSR
jgi:hypothetical protein